MFGSVKQKNSVIGSVLPHESVIRLLDSHERNGIWKYESSGFELYQGHCQQLAEQYYNSVQEELFQKREERNERIRRRRLKVRKPEYVLGNVLWLSSAAIAAFPNKYKLAAPLAVVGLTMLGHATMTKIKYLSNRK